MPIPPKPAAFTPEGVPVGVETWFASYWQTRAFITPRIQLCHTNAANGEGSVESSKNWLESAPGVHTLPHYQVDRDGRACKFLPTNRKGIANQTVAAYRGTHGTVQDWSLAYETADTGTLADPLISDYTDPQAETLATILAYESIVHGIPLELPTEWYGAGTASHTDPFGYPYWTNAVGKTCPGAKKKARLRNQILARAREIRNAWAGAPTPAPIPPIPSDEEDAVFLGFWRLSTDPQDAVYAVYSDGTKKWIKDQGRLAMSQYFASAAGKDATVHVTDDPYVMAALGPIVGDMPSNTDREGVTY